MGNPEPVAIGQHAPSKRKGISPFNPVLSGERRAYNVQERRTAREAGLIGRTSVHGDRVELERRRPRARARTAA